MKVIANALNVESSLFDSKVCVLVKNAFEFEKSDWVGDNIIELFESLVCMLVKNAVVFGKSGIVGEDIIAL